MGRSEIAECLCGVKHLPESYTACVGCLHSKCAEAGFCCIKNLNDQQVDYVQASIEEDIYLNACPGSGKTEVIGVKIAHEVKRWTQEAVGIAVLTFTNSAEDELRERIGLYTNGRVSYPHYVGTFTSWVHGYIANPFLSILTKYGGTDNHDMSLRLIDSECSSRFLDAYATKYTYGALGTIRAINYYFDAENKTKIIYSGSNREGQELLDELLSKDGWRVEELTKLKERFWEKGFVTYEDVEFLVCRLLVEKPEILSLVAKRFPFIVVDECQDLSFAQLEILRLLNEYGTKIHLVGDLDQAIYEFRRINPEKTRIFIKKLGMQEYRLNINYRSVCPIIDATGATLSKEKDYATSKLLTQVETPLIVILYKKNQEHLVVDRFAKITEASGLQLSNSRIIVRNNAVRERLQGRKADNQTVNTLEDFAHYVFLSGTSDMDSFQLSIRILARAIQRCYFSNEVHDSFEQLSKPVSVSGQAWRSIITASQRKISDTTEINNLEQTWGEWRKVITTTLGASFCATVPALVNCTPDFGRLRPKMGSAKVYRSFTTESKSLLPCKIETVHGCKGMSLDAVLFMSSYANNHEENGAHWLDWFAVDNNHTEECHRIAYVAFSRARHILVLGIPNPTSAPVSYEHERFLESIGFRIERIE